MLKRCHKSQAPCVALLRPSQWSLLIRLQDSLHRHHTAPWLTQTACPQIDTFSLEDLNPSQPCRSLHLFLWRRTLGQLHLASARRQSVLESFCGPGEHVVLVCGACTALFFIHFGWLPCGFAPQMEPIACITAMSHQRRLLHEVQSGGLSLRANPIRFLLAQSSGG